MADRVEELAAAVRCGDRAALPRAITRVESTRPDHREQAQQLLWALMPEPANAMHVGITGVPGAGKSTTIEALGMYLIEQGHRVAVLAVDPSSTRTGGSILGDKTRMGAAGQRASTSAASTSRVDSPRTNPAITSDSSGGGRGGRVFGAQSLRPPGGCRRCPPGDAQRLLPDHGHYLEP